MVQQLGHDRRLQLFVRTDSYMFIYTSTISQSNAANSDGPAFGLF